MIYAVDLETVGVNGGSPLDAMSCAIDLIAVSCVDRDVVYDDLDEARGVLEAIFGDPTAVVVMHNMLFDLPILMRLGYVPVLRAKVHDTRVLAWMLSSSRTYPRDLKSLVRRLFGVKMMTYQEAYITNTDMMRYEDLQFVCELLQGIVQRCPDDIKGFRSAIARIRNRKRYMATNPPVNLAVTGKTTLEMMQKVMSEASAAIVVMREEQQTLLFRIRGAQKGYALSDVGWTRRLYHKLVALVQEDTTRWRWFVAEMGVHLMAIEMTLTGIRLDRKILSDLGDALSIACKDIEADTYNAARQSFNMNSAREVPHVLFLDLGIEPPVFEEHETGTGIIQSPKVGKTIPKNHVVDVKNVTEDNIKYISADKYVLERINHPVATGILSFRTASKLLGTYVEPYLLSQAVGDPVLHAGFNPLGTQTGRWSSSHPNLQNVPSKPKSMDKYDKRIARLGPELRRAFVARPGKKFIIADMSQIELRLAAYITCDENMAAAYTESVKHDGIKHYTGDIHIKTAKALDVSRKLAKNINFGLIYGMSGRMFSIITPLIKPDGTYDIEMANRYRYQYFSLYRKIPEYITRANMAVGAGVTSFPIINGHMLHVHDIDRGATAFNLIVQGSASALLKMAMLIMNRYGRPKLPPFSWLLQVHDELCVEADEENAEIVAVVLKAVMEYPWTSVHGCFCPFDQYPVLASVKICNSWWDKDDDTVPEIGDLYVEYADHTGVVTPDKWPEFLAGEAPLVKGSVAMLSRDQRALSEDILGEAIRRMRKKPFFTAEFNI